MNRKNKRFLRCIPERGRTTQGVGGGMNEVHGWSDCGRGRGGENPTERDPASQDAPVKARGGEAVVVRPAGRTQGRLGLASRGWGWEEGGGL